MAYGPVSLLRLTETADTYCVFEAKHRAFGEVVATVYKDPTAAQVYEHMKVALMQAIFQGPEVSKVLDTQYVRVNDSFELVICSAPIVRSLYDEITARKSSNQPFTDLEVSTAAKSLIQSLASAQQHVTPTQSVSHGSVQPRSIGIDVKGQYRLLHFAGGVAVNDTVSQQVRCSHPYMSPELRDAETSEVAYNAYRSDVFSLGLTLFSMCKLQLLGPEARYSVSDLQAEVEELPYSESVRKQLTQMLAPAASDRPDFLALERHFWDGGQHTCTFLDSQCCSLDFNSCMDSPQYVPQNIEKVWFEFLKKQWQCCGPPLALYCLRGELIDCLQNSKEVDTALWEGDWIPIRELVAESEASTEALCILVKATGEQFRPLHKVRNRVCTISESESSCSFTISRRGERVTICEDPNKSPGLSRSLPPLTAAQVLPGQLYYLGPVLLSVGRVDAEGLEVHCFGTESRQYRLPGDSCGYRVGRAAECDIVFSEVEISKVHAVIWMNEGRWFIKDMGSRNGTWALCHTQYTQNRRSYEVVITKDQEFRTPNRVYRYTFEE